MLKPARLAPVLLPFVFLFLSAAAQADPLMITGGFVRIGSPGVAPTDRGAYRTISYDFSGSGFAVSGIELDGTRQGVMSCAFGPCVPGTSTSGGSRATLQGYGPSSILGIYSGLATPLGSVFTFGTPTFQIPDLTLNTLTVQLPFTMTGNLSLYAAGTAGLTPIFSSEVYGQGIATLLLSQFTLNGVTGYAINSIRYDFVAQTPEPATLLLLGTGLAGAAASARRRRRAARGD